MPVLVWDKVGERTYENGLDRGVLYLPDGSAVSWSGLTEVIEKFDREVNPIYFDGMKVNDFVVLGSFSATMKAVSYPGAVLTAEGIAEVREGVFIGDQPGAVFAFTYRTMIGNDAEGSTAGYKIHVIYNVTAIPSDRNFVSFGTDPSIVEYEWDITTIPTEVNGYRAASHIIIDSTDVDPWLLQQIEEILYGDMDSNAGLIPIDDFIDFITEWYRIKIIDNGDGTWTAIEQKDGANIIFLPNQEFIINGCNAIYLDDVTFLISDTNDITDIPLIDIEDNANGTWSAFTGQNALITEDPAAEMFTIKNATVVYLDADTYQISDTVE